MRSAASKTGHDLNTHFMQFTKSRWKVWALQKQDVDKIFTPVSILQVAPTAFHHMGVEPTLINSVQDIMETWDNTALGEPARASQPVMSAASSSVQNATKQVSAVGASSSSSLAKSVIEHVSHLAVPTQGGIVEYRYAPSTILDALEMKSKLKSGISIAEGLKAAVPLLLPRGIARQVVEEMADEAFPSDSRLREASIRVELLNCLYERKQNRIHTTWRYLNPDSSPQLGWDWLVIREDSWSFPNEEYTCNEQIADANFNRDFKSQTNMLSTLGRGHGGLLKKAFNIASQHRLISETEAEYKRMNEQVFGILSDMGTEKGVADVSTMEPIMGAGENTYKIGYGMQYPNALYMPEHLHIIYNCLQNSVEKMPENKSWIKKLRSVERFLADKSLRRLFIAKTQDARTQLFQSYSRVDVDWRWETLQKALDQLIPLWEPLMELYDPKKLMSGADGKSEAGLLHDVDAALKTPMFLEISELVRALGTELERFAHTLEGCTCHADVWTARGSHRRKASVMEERTGFKHCYMKGRQAVWLQTGGLKSLLDGLQRTTSDLLQKKLLAMDAAQRGSLVRVMSDLAETLAEELRDKLHFHTQLPYRALSIFVGESEGIQRTGEGRNYALQCMNEYDSLMASGAGPRLHRVAHRLFDKKRNAESSWKRLQIRHKD